MPGGGISHNLVNFCTIVTIIAVVTRILIVFTCSFQIKLKKMRFCTQHRLLMKNEKEIVKKKIELTLITGVKTL